MPISSVYSIAPVYATTSAVPSVSGAGATAAAIAAAAGGVVGGLADTIVFVKAVYTYDARGAPVTTYPAPVAMTGSVLRKGRPTFRAAYNASGGGTELRPVTDTTFEITTDSDPGDLLGAPVATNDRVLWAGLTLLVVGTAIPQGSGWLTEAVLTL